MNALQPMTAAQLRAILNDVPDDAPILINPVFAGEEPGRHAQLTVTQGEALVSGNYMPDRGVIVYLVADELP